MFAIKPPIIFGTFQIQIYPIFKVPDEIIYIYIKKTKKKHKIQSAIHSSCGVTDVNTSDLSAGRGACLICSIHSFQELSWCSI